MPMQVRGGLIVADSATGGFAGVAVSSQIIPTPIADAEPLQTRAQAEAALSAIREALLSEDSRVTIYEPLVADGYEWINACDDNDYETFLQLDGEPRGATWKPIKVRRVRGDERQAFNPSDFPWLGSHALVMRRTAVEALRDLCAHGEILPLATEDGVELFVFNARILDALDEGQSSLVMFPGTDRIMRISTIAFVSSAVRGVDMFRLPHRASSTYVSDRFVEQVRAAGLHGLVFNKVWSSE